jgi:putative peptidoglycan lipid II flippase
MPRTNTINAIISGTGIMIGRFSGLVREILFAYLFGTSSLIGLFKYAFALPNLARRIFGEGALSNAFIPILADLEKKNQYKAEEFCSKTISLFTFFNIILACLGIIVLIICGKTGLIAEENQQLVELGSIMFPYLPFICLCGILGSILNLHNSYKIPSLMSSTMNICLIASSCFAIYM